MRDALEERLEVFDPALPQKKTQGLKAGIDGALDHLGALGDEDAFLGLEHGPELALRELGIRLEAGVFEIVYADDFDCHGNSLTTCRPAAIGDEFKDEPVIALAGSHLARAARTGDLPGLVT